MCGFFFFNSSAEPNQQKVNGEYVVRAFNLLVDVHDFFVFGVVDAGHRHRIYITKATSIRLSIPLWPITAATTYFVAQQCRRCGRRIYVWIDVTIIITIIIIIIHTCRRFDGTPFSGN